MPPFWAPTFLQPRRPFHRLRSLHLSPVEVEGAMVPPHAPAGGTQFPGSKEERLAGVPITRPPSNLIIPLRGSTIITLAMISSLFFIMAISMSFLGADADEPHFMRTLDTLAETSPGVVLVGESVDVDIDEPSVTIRWSILACGEDFMLPGSAGLHGSNACGLPATPMHIYVDSDEPTATYDPEDIPFNRDSGARRSIQSLVQFDSDHVLDVHEARLYPFDTYFLSSTIRAVSFDNATIPIRKAATIDMTSSFDIGTIDLESYSTSTNGTAQASRDIDMRISRPNEARFFTLILFALSWVLAHVTVGHVLLARRLTGLRALLPHLISSGAVLIAIPHLRGSMPDAPGFDGVLIDSIGYFPQMIIVGISICLLLLILVARELDSMHDPPPPRMPFPLRQRKLPLLRFSRPPASPRATSTSLEIAQWEMHRMTKQLEGQYVFPPVKPAHRLQPAHRRAKTMSKMMEAGEVSYWSGER